MKKQLPQMPADLATENFRTGSEEGFYQLLTQTPLAIAILTVPDSIIDFVSDDYLFLINKNRDDVLNKPAAIALPSFFAQGLNDVLHTISLTGQTVKIAEQKVYFQRGSDPQTAWLTIIYQPLKAATGSIEKIIMLVNDVTEQVVFQDQKEHETAILQQTKSQLELSISIGHIGIWHYDVKNDILTWTDEQLRLYGLSRNEFGGQIKDFHVFVLPEDLHIVKRTGGEEQARNTDHEYQFRIRRKNGEQRWIQGRSRSFYGNNGELIFRIGVNIDITERKKAEEALRQSEELFRTAFANAATPISLTDVPGNFLYTNKAFHQLFGYAEDELKSILNGWLIHPDDHAKSLAEVEEWLEGNETALVTERRYVRKDGETVWGQVSFSVIRDGQGQPLTIIRLVEDITEEKQAREQLIESEQRFRSTFDIAAVGIAHVALNGSWLMANDRLCQIVGYTKEELLASTFQAITHTDDLDIDLRKVQALLAGKIDSYMLEKRYIHKSGATVWVNLTVSLVRGTQGAPKYFISVVEDISIRKKAEEQIRESEERLSLAIEAASLGLWDYDIHSNGVTVSDRTREFYNLSKDEPFTFERFLSVVHPDDKEWVAESNRNTFFGIGGSTDYFAEFRVIRKDSVVRWMRSTGKVFLNEAGQRYRFIGAIADITEEKLAAQVLQQSESRFRTLAEALPQMVWMMDAGGKTEYMSRQWELYSGITDINQAWKAMVHPDDWESLHIVWHTGLPKGHPFRHEVRLKNRSGEYRWHSSVVEPIKDEVGKVAKWIGTLTDIHVQKLFTERLEKEVAERTQELHRSNEDLQQFAHVASHDLKEPIRKVQTFGSRLEEEFGGLLPESGKLYLKKMLASSERMFGLIDGVLNYSMLNSLEAAVESVNLNEVLGNIEEDLEVVLQQGGGQIRKEHLPLVRGSLVLLNQLFYNLVSNALKFSKPGVAPVVSVSAKEVTGPVLQLPVVNAGERFTEIKICDNGIGFKPEYAERIFKTFTRLHSRDKYEGTGLGLALCKKIVERHGGHIYATSKESEGSCFYILLPV